MSNLQAVVRSTLSKRKAHRVTANIPTDLRADLAGPPRHDRGASRPNVLIVLVESASGAYLPTLASRNQVEATASMPKLDALASRALSFSTAIGHQRQTNRGEYSVLCGDFPKLRSETARMSEVALGQTRRRCLPTILGELGYTSAYLQAATMPFMLKDKFMKRIGFKTQMGAEGFSNAYASNAWGVDDHTFFEGALRFIEKTQSAGKPWFTTLLTVGTHHPYLVAPKCRATGEGFRRAFACADEALDEFVQQLRQRGILDDTLVIITADESAGVTEGQESQRTAEPKLGSSRRTRTGAYRSDSSRRSGEPE
ncbi:MAG: LTA synthase family protein [Polyangiaceae bacterium]